MVNIMVSIYLNQTLMISRRIEQTIFRNKIAYASEPAYTRAECAHSTPASLESQVDFFLPIAGKPSIAPNVDDLLFASNLVLLVPSGVTKVPSKLSSLEVLTALPCIELICQPRIFSPVTWGIDNMRGRGE